MSWDEINEKKEKKERKKNERDKELLVKLLINKEHEETEKHRRG